MIYHFFQSVEKEYRQQEHEQKNGNYTKDMLMAIIPLWKSYADKTGSSLFIEEFQGEIALMLTNSKRFDIGEEDIAIKLALGLATYIGIDMAENELQMCVSYSTTDMF